jgi:hypothetical protein
MVYIFNFRYVLYGSSLHFLSIEHLKFQKKYGTDKGNKITGILGLSQTLAICISLHSFNFSERLLAMFNELPVPVK